MYMYIMWHNNHVTIKKRLKSESGVSQGSGECDSSLASHCRDIEDHQGRGFHSLQPSVPEQDWVAMTPLLLKPLLRLDFWHWFLVF